MRYLGIVLSIKQETQDQTNENTTQTRKTKQQLALQSKVTNKKRQWLMRIAQHRHRETVKATSKETMYESEVSKKNKNREAEQQTRRKAKKQNSTEAERKQKAKKQRQKCGKAKKQKEEIGKAKKHTRKETEN